MKDCKMFAPWWAIYLARIFGKKRFGYDSGYKMTTYTWRGIIYVWDIELDTEEPT